MDPGEQKKKVSVNDIRIVGDLWQYFYINLAACERQCQHIVVRSTLSGRTIQGGGWGLPLRTFTFCFRIVLIDRYLIASTTFREKKLIILQVSQPVSDECQCHALTLLVIFVLQLLGGKWHVWYPLNDTLHYLTLWMERVCTRVPTQEIIRRETLWTHLI